MSRVSQKSKLSPSITKGNGGGIDLGKNSGIDMGRKSTPSVTSGGIGITQEITNVGGVSVSGGVSVDISPLNIGINYDPSENSLGVSGGAEIPGGILGVSGGITIDLNTGQVIGGSIGGEALGLGINISSSKEGGLGVEFTLQIPFTPIELSLGFGSLPKKPGSPATPNKPKGIGWGPDNMPPLDENCIYRFKLLILSDVYHHFNRLPADYQSDERWERVERLPPGGRTVLTGFAPNGDLVLVSGVGDLAPPDPEGNGINGNYAYVEDGSPDYKITEYFGIAGNDCTPAQFRLLLSGYYMKWGQPISVICRKLRCHGIPQPFQQPDPPPPPPSSSPPFPNPPPRRRNMDECCRYAIALARQNRRFLQEAMIMWGRPLDSKGNLIPIPVNANFLGEKIERVKTPIKNAQAPEKETVTFANFYELQMYALRQQINLDVGIDPQSFIAPEGEIQNPYYQRDSEESLKTNTQPNTDKTGNKRELTIGKDIKINSLTQQQQYIFEALKRLEYLFPSGELSDAKFDKSLIIPGAVGELKVHNLIHFQEFFAQYLNATLGDPKIPVKVEDNNALKAGKQEAIFRHFSIAQMIRELYKVTLESGDDINAIMETGVRDFRTNLANRIQIVQAVEMLQALVEDTGMLESQDFIPLKLEGDPYAGKWKAGMGFEPDVDLDSNEEAATERLMRATLKNFEAQVKVIRRDKRENSDIRDLLIQIAEMFIRSTSIPATKEGIEKALAAAKFKTQVDMALTRSQVKRAAAASRARTKKRKKA